MRRFESVVVAAVALVLSLGLAAEAKATAFTLASSVTLADPNSDLEVILLPDSTVSGPASCVSGTCTLTNDFVVFRVEVTHVDPSTLPNVDEIGASVAAIAVIEGVGVFTAGSDVEPSSGSGAGGFQAIWDFDSPNLTDGDFSDPLFVTYTSSLSEGATINFMVHPVGGVLFSSPPNTTLVIVPEPSTLGLMAAVLTSLAAVRFRRRRSR
jgi:hypothetical protein